MVPTLFAVIACSGQNNSPVRSSYMRTLRDYASEARDHGEREALVPYGADEEEGEMLAIPTFDDGLFSYEWIVGKPIEERTFGFARMADSTEPDSIYTAYRVRVEARFGRSKHPRAFGPFEAKVMSKMTPARDEILVVKSGGNLIVEGVLLKKRGSLCFSELMPRRYLLGLAMNASGRIGLLELGCRSIFSLNGDRLVPRQTSPEAFTNGMRERFNNSLTSFSRAFQGQRRALDSGVASSLMSQSSHQDPDMWL